MRKKILILFSLIFIICTTAFIGLTSSSYFLRANLTGSLDYIKAIGSVDIYHPDWVWGWDGGEKTFTANMINAEYNNIHFEITNSKDGKINEETVDIYVRIVDQTDGNEIPVEYDVHEYNTPSAIKNKVGDNEYGPLKLGAKGVYDGLWDTAGGVDGVKVQYFSLRARYIGGKARYFLETQKMKLQIGVHRENGSFKVIAETPLSMKYTGGYKTTIRYYAYNKDNPRVVDYLDMKVYDRDHGNEITPEKLPSGEYKSIDFKNNNLASFGIVFPNNPSGGEYTFEYANDIPYGSGSSGPQRDIRDKIEICGVQEINIYLITKGTKLVHFNYVLGSTVLAESAQLLNLNIGSLIKFIARPGEPVNYATFGIVIPRHASSEDGEQQDFEVDHVNFEKADPTDPEKIKTVWDSNNTGVVTIPPLSEINSNWFNVDVYLKTAEVTSVNVKIFDKNMNLLKGGDTNEIIFNLVDGKVQIDLAYILSQYPGADTSNKTFEIGILNVVTADNGTTKLNTWGILTINETNLAAVATIIRDQVYGDGYTLSTGTMCVYIILYNVG